MAAPARPVTPAKGGMSDVKLDGGRGGGGEEWWGGNTGAAPASSPKPAIDLEWQSFPTAAATGGGPAVTTAATVNASSGASVDAGGASPGAGGAGAGATVSAVPPIDPAIANPLSCITPGFYTYLFNVDTADVAARLRHAAWPVQPVTFLQAFGAKPDLYGPLWLCATLVFIIGATSNLAAWLSFTQGGAVSIWKYDFRLVTLALFVVYGFALVAPAAVWVVINYLGLTGLTLVHLVFLYGYSLAVFNAAAMLCIVPSVPFQWLVCLAASCVSALLLFRTLWPIIITSLPVHIARVVCLAVCVATFGFGAVMKMYFFSFY